jgi:hypothetical protein
MSAITLTHRFGSFELPSHDRSGRRFDRQPTVPTALISDLIPTDKIRISTIAAYRLTADEHDILFSALKDSLEIRTTLHRE